MSWWYRQFAAVKFDTKIVRVRVTEVLLIRITSLCLKIVLDLIILQALWNVPVSRIQFYPHIEQQPDDYDSVPQETDGWKFYLYFLFLLFPFFSILILALKHLSAGNFTGLVQGDESCQIVWDICLMWWLGK